MITPSEQTREEHFSSSDRELVTMFLKGCEAKCPACGYALTDLPGGVCPECGLSLELRLALTRPRQRLYLAGLIGLGAGVGFHGLLLLYFAWISWFLRSGFGPSFFDVIPLLVGLSVEVPLIVVWARSWGFFQRCSRRVGVTLVTLGWLCSAGTAFWFFGWID